MTLNSMNTLYVYFIVYAIAQVRRVLWVALSAGAQESCTTVPCTRPPRASSLSRAGHHGRVRGGH